MKNLMPVEYNSQKILTTEQLAEFYGVDAKLISYNFNYNKDRYTEGKDYFFLEGNDLKTFKSNREFHDYSRAPSLYLWTKRGTFLHAKSINTDQAWDVYEMLVDNYFDKPADISLESAQQALALIDQFRAQLTKARRAIVQPTRRSSHLLPGTLEDKVRYQIAKFTERKRVGPSLTDLQNYLKNHSREEIADVLDELVKRGELEVERTSHTVRYTLRRPHIDQSEAV